MPKIKLSILTYKSKDDHFQVECIKILLGYAQYYVTSYVLTTW